MIDTAILALLAAACFVAGVWLGTWVFPLLWHARARRRLREIEELRERWRVER